MSSIHLSWHRPDILLLTLDMPGKSANILTTEVWEDLDRALDEVQSRGPAGVIVVSAKPAIFVAGADLVRISQTLDWPDEEIIRFCENGRTILRKFTRIPAVSVAAVHGACVGGGMELALWCDYRIAADEPKTQFGLPEVRLGLVPGWAGTVRLPRLIGLEPAVDMITSGRTCSAAESLKLGIVSRLVPREHLVREAERLIDESIAANEVAGLRRAMDGPVRDLPSDIGQFASDAENRIRANREIHPSAPLVVLRHMLATASVDAAEAADSESQAMAQVYGSPESRGLLHFFFLEERARKTRADYAEQEPVRVERLGVVGAGLMGSQIARLALAAGFQVLLFDANRPRLEERAASLKTGSTSGEALSVADSLEDFATCDLVVESIVEKLAVKQQLFQRLEKIVRPDAILATNTSTIPVSDITKGLAHPERVVGLHFCCPVEPLRLVEIIRAAATSHAAANVAIDLVRAMRKTPVLVADRPGFVVNRLLCPVFSQSLEWLLRGVSAREIDAPFREFGFAVGPLEMIDFIGVDTIMYAGETFLRTLPGVVTANPVLPALVKRGRLGRKSGSGFYRYETFDGSANPDPELDAILARYQQEPQTADPTTILNSLLQPMVAAGEEVLATGVVEDPRDVDLCSILGTTFPAAKGGLLFWSRKMATPGHG